MEALCALLGLVLVVAVSTLVLNVLLGNKLSNAAAILADLGKGSERTERIVKEGTAELRADQQMIGKGLREELANILRESEKDFRLELAR